MQRKGDWRRVSKRRPCQICGRPDWCLVTGPEGGPTAAICARTESPRRCGEAGWLHVLRDNGPTWSPRIRKIELSAARATAPPLDFAKLAAEAQQAVRPEALERLAISLGVSAASLRRLGIGLLPRRRAWCFPMADAADRVLGLRLRWAGDRKLGVKGGREGLFIPDDIGPGKRLLVAEGASDCAAMMGWGFSAVGRPSCSGGVRLLVELVQRLRPDAVFVVADNDQPDARGRRPGQDRPERLAAALLAYCRDVRVIVPPPGVKDSRAWRQGGATTADVLALIDAAPVRRLTMVHRRRNRRHHGNQ